MKSDLPRDVQWVRSLALVEGVSFLVLLLVAMPLKYMWDMPLAVKVVGWVHGALFMALVTLLLQVTVFGQWPLRRAVMVLVAGLLPFGPFVLDRRLRQAEQWSR